jgi:4-oxalocrotonate tautomerase
MPLVRIDLRQGKPPEYCRKIGDMVYCAMRETINMPEHDRFQVIADHPAEELVYDPSCLGINRTDDSAFIQITLNAGADARSEEGALCQNRRTARAGILDECVTPR